MSTDRTAVAPPGSDILAALRAELAARGVTTAQLGAALGVSQASASRKLAGRQPMTVAELSAALELAATTNRPRIVLAA